MHPFDIERPVQQVYQVFGQLAGLLGIGAVLAAARCRAAGDYEEFVASESDENGFGYKGGKSLGEIDQQRVSTVSSDRFIDLLETVQIESQDPVTYVAESRVDDFGSLFLQESAIGQPGEEVMIGDPVSFGFRKRAAPLFASQVEDFAKAEGVAGATDQKRTDNDAVDVGIQLRVPACLHKPEGAGGP